MLTEAARCGLLGASLPRNVGGLGMSLPEWGKALGRVGYLCGDASFALNISLFQSVANMLMTSRDAFLVERYVAPVCTGERLVGNYGACNAVALESIRLTGARGYAHSNQFERYLSCVFTPARQRGGVSQSRTKVFRIGADDSPACPTLKTDSAVTIGNRPK